METREPTQRIEERPGGPQSEASRGYRIERAKKGELGWIGKGWAEGLAAETPYETGKASSKWRWYVNHL